MGEDDEQFRRTQRAADQRSEMEGGEINVSNLLVGLLGWPWYHRPKKKLVWCKVSIQEGTYKW